MSGSAAQVMINTLKGEGLAQVKLQIAAGKKAFLATFATYLDPVDLVTLDEICSGMVATKVRQWDAVTEDEARFAQDEYEALRNAIDALFLRYEVIGKAKLGVVARSMAHQLVAGAFAVGGAVLQAGLGIVFPFVGSLVGAGINIGIQKVVGYFLGD